MIKRMNPIFICSITESHIKAVKYELKSDSTRQSAGFEAEEIPPGADDKLITQRLSGILNRLGFRNNPLIIALPRSKVTCRYLKVPAQTPKETEKIVALQTSRYLPYPQEELISGYELISTDKEGYSNINLIIAHKDVINRYVNICAPLNAQTITIVLSSYGLLNLYNQQHPQEASAVMLIDIDSSHMEMVVIERSKLIFSRYFKVDVSNPNWESVFVNEVAKSRDAYAKEFAREAPQKILVTGQEKVAGSFAGILNKQGGFSAEAMPQKETGADTSFSSLMGLGLKGIPYSLNLLPQDLKDGFKKRARHQEYAQLGLFVAAIIVFLGLGIAKNLDNKLEYLKKLKKEIDKISQEVKPLKDIEKRLAIASGTVKDRPSSLEVFSEVQRIIPSSIALTDFIYETGKEVVLRGQAQELGSVFGLVSQLESSALFKKFTVKVRYATKRKTTAGEVIGFEIICERI